MLAADRRQFRPAGNFRGGALTRVPPQISTMETNSATVPLAAVDRSDAGTLLAVGFVVWVAATAVTRLFGATLLQPATPLLSAALYALMLPSMAALVLVSFRYLDVTGAARAPAAALLVLPGMTIDSVLLPAFGTAFPAVDPSMAGAFGGIVLVAYATVLATALLTS